MHAHIQCNPSRIYSHINGHSRCIADAASQKHNHSKSLCGSHITTLREEDNQPLWKFASDWKKKKKTWINVLSHICPGCWLAACFVTSPHSCCPQMASLSCHQPGLETQDLPYLLIPDSTRTVLWVGPEHIYFPMRLPVCSTSCTTYHELVISSWKAGRPIERSLHWLISDEQPKRSNMCFIVDLSLLSWLATSSQPKRSWLGQG